MHGEWLRDGYKRTRRNVLKAQSRRFVPRHFPFDSFHFVRLCLCCLRFWELFTWDDVHLSVKHDSIFISWIRWRNENIIRCQIFRSPSIQYLYLIYRLDERSSNPVIGKTRKPVSCFVCSLDTSNDWFLIPINSQLRFQVMKIDSKLSFYWFSSEVDPTFGTPTTTTAVSSAY